LAGARRRSATNDVLPMRSRMFWRTMVVRRILARLSYTVPAQRLNGNVGTGHNETGAAVGLWQNAA
jgi:hypothetical protein